MLKDPEPLGDGVFPYDALGGVGITPQSTMKAVLDASFDLLEAGAMTPEVRRAWDRLRLPAERLFVDFFLYQIDWSTALAQATERAGAPLLASRPPVDLAAWLAIDPAEVERAVDECGVSLEPVAITPPTDFDWMPPLPGADIARYDG